MYTLKPVATESNENRPRFALLDAKH